MSDQARIAVPNELFVPAESSSFKGSFDLARLEAGFDLYDFTEPLTWQVDITNTGEALLVTGTVEGEARTSCARCLNSFSLQLLGEIEGYYCFPESIEENGELDDDDYDILPDDHVIDLEDPIRAALLLDVPLVPLCKEDCKGICPDCGTDLNETSCDCADRRAREEAEKNAAANPFASLKDFPFEQS